MANTCNSIINSIYRSITQMPKFFWGVIALLIISFIGCGKRHSDKLIVVTSADYAPYEYLENGQVVGLEIDIIKAIAQDMKREIEIQNVDFAGVLPSIVHNRADMAIAGLSITHERLKTVDFSDVYLTSPRLAVISLTENGINKIEDLEGKIIGTQTGSSSEAQIKVITKKLQIVTIKSLSNNLIILEELKNGRINAMVTDDLQTKFYMQSGMTKYTFASSAPEHAIAFPKGSKLKAAVNRSISKLKMDGTLDRIRNKWISKD